MPLNTAPEITAQMAAFFHLQTQQDTGKCQPPVFTRPPGSFQKGALLSIKAPAETAYTPA